MKEFQDWNFFTPVLLEKEGNRVVVVLSEGARQVTANMRTVYSHHILRIVCRDFRDERDKQSLVAAARNMAKRLGRDFKISVAYATLVVRLVIGDDVDHDIADQHAKTLGKNLAVDIETVRQFIADLEALRRAGQ